MMGLLPKLVSEGTGAEIQRPLATVVFGGLLTATVMTLLVVPSVYGLINRDEPDAGKPADDISLDELAEPETPVTH
jgi:Cu/Ag efflux pump CusA